MLRRCLAPTVRLIELEIDVRMESWAGKSHPALSAQKEEDRLTEPGFSESVWPQFLELAVEFLCHFLRFVEKPKDNGLEFVV